MPFDPDATVRAFCAGQRMFGRYLLTEILGRGTIGVVWLAKDEILGGLVALKLLPEVVVFDAVAISDLKHETQRSLQLTHPNIVRIYDFWEEAGRAAISMEYVDGSTLTKTRLKEPSRVFSPQALLPYIEQLAEALDYAHTRARVVHRDLKPANLLVNSRGELKVADFGIADTLNETATRLSRPLPGASGSPPYMSPQQMLGEKPSVSDDIYSLGATIYELLTSKPPLYSGNIFAQAQGKVPPPMHQRRADLLGDAARDLPPIPPEWERTIAACLAKDPALRPPSALAVAAGLAGKNAERVGRARFSSPAAFSTPTPGRPRRWRPRLVPLLALAGAVVVAGAFVAKPFSHVRGLWNEKRDPALVGQGDPATTAAAVPETSAAISADAPLSPPPPSAELAGASVLPPLPAPDTTAAAETAAGAFGVAAADTPNNAAIAGAARLASLDASASMTDAPPPEPVVQDEALAAVSAATKTDASSPESLPTDMAPASAPWRLRVEPADAGARVWIGPLADQAVPASGWLELTDLAPGDHELVVQAPGYQPLLMNVGYDPSANAPPAVARLVPVRGALEVVARAGSTVSATIAEGRRMRLGEVPSSGRLEVNDLLRVGTYELLIEHPDFSPVVVSDVNVRNGRLVTARVEQVALPGELRVFTVPFGAEVWLDGIRVATTPATLPGQPSGVPLAVEVRLRGYRSAVEQVTLQPNEVRSLTLPALVPEAGELRLRLEPGDIDLAALTITVDGRPARTESGVLHDLDLGERDLVVSHPDYETWRGRAVVEDATVTDVPVALVEKPGVLHLTTTPAGATVRLTGANLVDAFCEDDQGRELLTPFQGTVPPGDYTVTLRLADHVPVVRRVRVGANETLSVSAKFKSHQWPEEGRPWSVPELDLVMAWMPPGQFTLGSPLNETGRFHNEGPQTRVTLTRGFWMGQTEVTQREWQLLMGNNRSDHRGSNLPVTNVSWNDAMAFCRKLTERERLAGRLPEGFVYTLPMEVQWEYAARAGTDTRFYSGNRDADLARVGWYSANSDGRAHPVAAKNPNAWGLYDMHGNVWEWTMGWIRTFPGGAIADTALAPTATQVLRGGSWLSSANFNRSAVRSGTAGTRYGVSVIGFRIALTEKLDRPLFASGD